MHFVKKAEIIDDSYSLKITFENGEVKRIDMEPYLENKSLIFRPLKQKDIFKMFEIKGNTVSWITGADVSPDFLYKKGENFS